MKWKNSSVWASVINTVGEGDIADLVILAITVVLFVVGFIVGVITIEYRVGTAVLGTAGGMSIMMRIILMREELLVPVYYVNWLLCALFGAVGLVLVAWKERWGVVSPSFGYCSFGHAGLTTGRDKDYWQLSCWLLPHMPRR